jgi:integrase/recombinase XerC
MEIRGDDSGALFFNFHHDPKVRQRISGAGLYHLIMDLGQRQGIRVTPHGLRHLAITDVLDIGVGIRDAQRFSRHKDPNTLLKYDDNRSDIAGKVAQQLEDLDEMNDF